MLGDPGQGKTMGQRTGSKSLARARGRRSRSRRKREPVAPKEESVDPESHHVQEYLEAIYTLTEDGGAARTSDLARCMGVTPASVTGMVQKFSRAGLVEYRKYRGVTLTEEGMRLGRRMKRKHRILERFLNEVLGISREDVHTQACALEHSLSDEAETAMCCVLGHPEVCPDDGKPIPPCETRLEGGDRCPGEGEECTHGERPGRRRVELRPVTELSPGQKGTIALIRGGTSVVRRLNDMGLTPDTQVQVEEIAPFKGPVQLRVRGCSLVVGRGIASKILVHLV